MADNIYVVLCSCALRRIGADGVDQIVALLGDHLSDQGQRLTKALSAANDRAWKALEIALAGETLWNKLNRAEDRSFRQQLAVYLQQLPLPELQDKQQFRRKCLQELRDARKKTLLGGRLVPDELARRAGPMANRSDPQAVLAAEKQALRDMAAALKEEKLESLAWLLEQQPQPGQSVLIVGVRYYFQRQVEEDAALARRLQFTGLESLTESQQKGFQQLDEGLKASAERVEEAMADLAEAAEQIRGLAGEIRDHTLDLRSEMEKMHGENKEFSARVLQMLEQQQLHQRPVHAGDSLSIRSDFERQKVKEFLAHYRQMPEAEKKAAPALLNGLGKLQVATGDYQSAQEAFERVAELSPDDRSCAEGHYNAYRAALERAAAGEASFPDALAELQLALRFDPTRFTPFPLDDYEPRRILGAGGFGVTFLCKKKLTGHDVAVKAFRADGLERDVSAVMQEASMLDQLQHPAIIRLRHCGYADAGHTRPFIEMDYFESQTLEEYVEQHGPMSVADVLAVAKPLAEALLAAHGQGILHRDVKPANLLVRRVNGQREVRVIDFGLALKQSLLGASASSSRRDRSMTGAAIAGTRRYAAPEQMADAPGVRVGPRADIYGFAKTCCFALFQNTEPTLLDYKKVPENLGVLLSRCLARLPDDRPTGFAEVLQKLNEMGRPERAPKRKPAEQEPVLPVATLLEDVPYVVAAPRPKRAETIPVAKLSGRTRTASPAPTVIASPEKTKAPAIALLAVAVLATVINLIACAYCSFAGSLVADNTPQSMRPGFGSNFNQIEAAESSSARPLDPKEARLALLLYVPCLLASSFAIFGGVAMLRRKAYWLAVVGAGAVLLGGCTCAMAGPIVGTWALIVLMKPGIKETFT
jgi:tetratricopeptide (TPR) repeat protein